MIKMLVRLILAGVVFSAMPVSSIMGQMRLATWNVTYYSGGRYPEFQTSIYGSYSGRSFAPSCLVGQEFYSASAVTDFTNMLNTASGSPGDWSSAPFVSGPDSQSAFFYRSSLFNFLGVSVVAYGGLSPEPPRNILRFDVSPKGYAPGKAPTIAIYSTHMKSGTSTDDQNRRLKEAQYIRANAQALPSSWFFALGGDLNIPTSTQAAYQELVGSKPNNNGRFFDPIKSPGSWNNNSAFRYIHTQDPIGAGGMDDRHDQLLLSEDLIDGVGFDYIGNPTIAYSTSTWNDPNHSYRCWGNDGTSYNTSLTITGNTMVGDTIAQALVTTAQSGGHLPVFLDLRLPAQLNAAPSTLNLGNVPFGSPASAALSVFNGVDTTAWGSSSFAPLNYTMSATTGITAPIGTFSASAGLPGNTHWIDVATSAYGVITGSVTVQSTDPFCGSQVIPVWANVVTDASAQITKPADGDPVNIVDVVVTAVFPDYFYIEQQDRASGIRVEKPSHGAGYNKVNVTGRILTNADGERYIEAVTVENAGAGSVIPLGMNNFVVGGANTPDYNVSNGTGQRGIAGKTALNNIGLLVRVWGKVTQIDSSPSPAWFDLDGGSSYPVRVMLANGASAPPLNSYTQATGACSCYLVSGVLYPKILTRYPSDIVVLAAPGF